MKPSLPCIFVAAAVLAQARPPDAAEPAVAPPLTAAPQTASGAADLDRLVRDLGSSDWKKREKAQEELLEAGMAAVTVLEGATRSGNPELAHRARFLLESIDPAVTEFRIVKIEIGGQPRAAEVAEAFGTEGKEIVARGRPERPGASSYTIEFHTTPGDLLDIRVFQTGQGSQRTELHKPLGRPEAVSLLKTSEEATYSRMGLRMERRRQRFVTVMWTRRGRYSLLMKSVKQVKLREALDRLVEKLFRQARSPQISPRIEALEVLAQVRPEGMEALVDEALRHPRTRDAAGVMSGLAEQLLAVLQRPAPAEASGARLAVPSLRPPSVRLLAALELFEQGHDAGFRYLLDSLLDAPPFDFHLACAALADAVGTKELPQPRQHRLVARAFSSEVLKRAPWDDIETEYFLLRLLDVVDARIEANRRRLLSFQENLQRLLQGGYGLTRPAARTCLNLWMRTVQKLEGKDAPSSLDFLLRVLPSVGSAQALAAIMPLVETAVSMGAPADEAGGPRKPGQLNRVQLETLCSVLYAQMETGDPTRAARGHQSLLRLSRLLSLQKGQLKILVAALVKAGEAAAAAASPELQRGRTTAGLTSFAVRQTEQELGRWTGLSGRSTARSTEATFDAAIWREWLSRGDLVEKREAELARRATLGARPARGEEFTYYEFDLELKAPPREGGPTSSPRSFRILDGRRLGVQAGKPAYAVDRWGNAIHVLLEPQLAGAAGSPRRVRLNKRSMVYVGVPSFATLQGRELSVVQYETSDAARGSHFLTSPGNRLPTFRTLVLVAPPEAKAVIPASPSDAASLWKAFVERYVLGAAAAHSPQQIARTLDILRTLDIPGRVPMLRRLFKQKPSAEIARLLHEAGDPSGLEYLRKELFHSSVNRRVLAALSLCEMGEREGVDALLRDLKKTPSAMRAFSYQVLGAFDAYLAARRADDPDREAILDFLCSHLSDQAYQYRAFRLLERELGEDFGYAAARRMSQRAARDQAVDAAVERARAFWEHRKAR